MRNRDKNDDMPETDTGEFEAAGAGWDPYIFSILGGSERSYSEERRRAPRPLNAERRRARLLSKQQDS